MVQKKPRVNVPLGTGVIQVHLKMPPKVKAAAQAEAARRGISFSRFMTETMAREIGMPVPWEEPLPKSA